jgi:trans-aconitate 2-methyltransferase
MQTGNDWNPELYLQFNKERTQPSIDLVSRINHKNPHKIIDIGCGPGNSTQILFQRWPESDITGADNSPAMIQKAKTDYPDQKWILFDGGKDELNEKFDIVFSNATIQWIAEHEKLLAKFSQLLNDQGVLAVQLPLFFDMDVGKAIKRIASEQQWNSATRGVEELFTIHTASFYFDQLSKHFSEIELWKTQYIHIMESHKAIFEMLRSTAIKPYLDRLPDQNDKLEFGKQVLSSIEVDYPVQKNGKVLFPFKRLFFIAKKINGKQQ